MHICKWDYNGLGLEYHILAGPAFILVFTITALGWGYLADKKNRVRCFSLATFFFSLAILGTSFATEYWHVFVARMFLAAWYTYLHISLFSVQLKPRTRNEFSRETTTCLIFFYIN